MRSFLAKYVRGFCLISLILHDKIDVCQCIQSNSISLSLTRDYFTNKYVHQIMILGCWDSFGNMDFFGSDTLLGIKTSFVNIRDADGKLMRKALQINQYRLGVVLDLDCSESNNLFEQIVQEKIAFNESYFWLILSKSSEIPVERLKDLPLTIATEMTLALWKNNDHYFLYDVYNPSYRHGGPLNITFMGYWTKRNGIDDQLTHQYKYKRRQDMHGLTLNFSIFLNYQTDPDLVNYLTIPNNRHLDTMIRFHYNIILHLRDTFNFSIHMTRTNTWGYLVNGTYNGIVGDIVNGIVDIGGAPMQYKRERLDVLEYTVPTYIARSCIIFRHPKQSQVRNVFLKPFTQDVWWMILSVAIIYWLLLLLTVRLELRLKLINEPPSCTLETNPESETALITTAAVCQQGLSDGPRVYSGRIIFLSLFLWGFVLYQFYSASIVGSLLAQPPRFITSLKALVDSNLDITVEDIAYNYDYFATTSDPLAHEIMEKKIKKNKKRKSYLTPTQGLKAVQRGGVAFQVDSATAYRLIRDSFSEDEICELQEVQLFPSKYVSTVTAKNSPFKKMLSYALRKIVEHGLAYRLRKVWHERKPQCPESHNSNPVPVQIHEFSPALLALLLGISFSFCVMLAEMFFANSIVIGMDSNL